MEQRIKFKIHEVCGRDDLRPALQHILIDKGFAIATDANVLIKADLRQQLTAESLTCLEGKLIHFKTWKMLYNQQIIHVNSERIRILHKTHGVIDLPLLEVDEKYPDWERVLTDCQNNERHETPVIAFDVNKLKKLTDAMFTISDKRVQLNIKAANKGIIVTKNDDSDSDAGETIGLLMPCMVTN